MANWYSIWTSAVSVAFMCALVDEEGVWVQKGRTPLSLVNVVVCKTDATL